MIKDIVVNLGLGTSDPAGDYAVSIAEAFGAHLLGVAVSYEPVIPGNVMGGVPPELIESQRVESNKKARATIAINTRMRRYRSITADGSLRGSRSTLLRNGPTAGYRLRASPPGLREHPARS